MPYFDELEEPKTFNDKGNSYFTNALAPGRWKFSAAVVQAAPADSSAA